MFEMGPVVTGRVLGYTLMYAPNTIGRDSIARDINSYESNVEALAGLAFLYVHGLLRVFRNPNGPTPAASADQSLDEAAINQLKTSTAHKNQILLRENYTCSFSYIPDKESVRNGLIPEPPNSSSGRTQVAHIISQCLADGIECMTEAAKAKMGAACASAILDRFAGVPIHTLLGSLNLHTPLNAFLAWCEPHCTFDELRMRLTPTKDTNGNVVPDTYDICVISNTDECHDMRDQIAFRQCNYQGVTVHPPSPQLLELHTACVKIAHLSGAADVLQLYDETPSFAGLAVSFT
ncbi:hypothetical protein B0H19DRAFT_1273454 [Mycena capillaripes]|nr:hypothetical protein B0H19DRAFT_1273454 [Mycena capillaripes]